MFIALPSVQRRLSNNIWKIERLAGVVLMVFGAGILWRFFTSV